MTMATIEFDQGVIQVDARTIEEGLGINPSILQERMREGKITSRCERGIDEDDGRYRLTFFSESRRFRLVVDKKGIVVQRSTIDFSHRPLPSSERKSGWRSNSRP